jgi:hypothetical protein
MSRWVLPVPAVPDQTQRFTVADPVARGELVHRGGVDGGVGGEVELLEPFRAGESGRGESSAGATPSAVVAFGHHQLGQNPR